jgi:phenylpropionate dioxygenase-like ring-hydroxylating dioxygenase large terminal subunit
MNDIVKTVRAQFPGNNYGDIARADGDVPAWLVAESNPPQPTVDVPFSRYTSRAFHDLEMQKVWRKVWQFACREEHVADVGDYYVYDIGRSSVLIVRTEQGLKAYANSCLHRGTKLKASGTSGYSPHIQCLYHGWQWHLDGGIKHIPCAYEFPQLDESKVALPEYSIDTFQGMVFVNLAKEGPGLLEYLEVLPEHFRNFDLTKWYVHAHVQKRLPANWKLAYEAFMEAYHTPFVHPEMSNVVSDHNMQHDIFSDHISRDLCAMASPSPNSRIQQTQQQLLDNMLVGDGAAIGERPQVPPGRTARWVMAERLKEQLARDFKLDYSRHSVPEMIDSLKYTVFPNLYVYPAAGLNLIQCFRPDGDDPDRCLFDQYVLRPKPIDGSAYTVAEKIVLEEHQSWSEAPGMDPFLALVLDQDTDIMRWQREGMYASEKGAESLALYQEARIRHLHSTLDKYLQR